MKPIACACAALLAMLSAGCLVTPDVTCDAAGGPVTCDPGFLCNAQTGQCEPEASASASNGSSGSTQGSGSSGGTNSSSGTAAGSGSTTGTSSTSSGSTGSTGVVTVAEVSAVGAVAFGSGSSLYDVAIAGDGTPFGADLGDNALVSFSAGQATLVAGGNGFAEHRDGPGGSALLAAPWGMTFVGSTLYFFDSGSSGAYAYLRKLDSGIVTTVCGAGVSSSALNGACSVAQFAGPAGMAYDGSRYIYVADYGESRIQRVDLNQLQVDTWAGSATAGASNGQGIAAQFSNPSAVAVDAQGNVFVADFGNMAIRKIDPARNVTTFAQMPYASPVLHGRPFGIAVDALGNVYASDVDNNQIDRWSADGTLTAQISDPNLSLPVGMKVDPQGGLYVATAGGTLLHVTIP